MTAEGVFPKIGGDIAYASEANRFAGAGRALFTGSFQSIAATGEMGSIVIGAGSLTNVAHIQGAFRGELGNTNNSYIIRVSGAQGYNTALQIGSNVGDGNIFVDFNIIAGSPLVGNFLEGTAHDQSTMSSAAVQHSYSAMANNGNTADSGLVVFFGGSVASAATIKILGISIQSFRGGL